MSEKSEDIEWIKQKAEIFMDIMLGISEYASIIPMKFLTIFSSEERVKEAGRENYEQIKTKLNRIKGKTEMSVKFYCDEKTFKQTAMQEEISAFEKSLAGKPQGAAYFLRKKFESEMSERIQKSICKAADSMAGEMKSLAADMQINKNLAREITGIDVPMVLNCAFLIDANDREAFDNRAKELSDQYKATGFLVECSGPWPVYSFV